MFNMMEETIVNGLLRSKMLLNRITIALTVSASLILLNQSTTLQLILLSFFLLTLTFNVCTVVNKLEKTRTSRHSETIRCTKDDDEDV